MIVEAIGPTASGKTTVVDAMLVELRERGFAVRTSHEVVLGPLDRRLPAAGPLRAVVTQVATFPDLLFQLARRPRLAASLFSTAWRHGERLSFRINCARNAARRLGVAGAVWRADRLEGRRGVIIVDEGLVHFVDMLAESGRAPSAAEVAAYARHIPSPDLVLRVHAPEEVRTARVLARGHRRLGVRGAADVTRYVANGEVATDLVARLPLLAPRVIRIEAGSTAADLDAAVDAACGAVISALARRHASLNGTSDGAGER